MEHLRTSEDERQRVVTFLRDCCAEGYLDIDELDARQSTVLHSRTRGELAALVADMPDAAAVLPGDAGAPPTFVKPRRGHATAMVIALVALLTVMVLVSVPVFELAMLGGLILVLGIFALVVFAALSPWLAAGALVAWSVNRLQQGRSRHLDRGLRRGAPSEQEPTSLHRLSRRFARPGVPAPLSEHGPAAGRRHGDRPGGTVH